MERYRFTSTSMTRYETARLPKPPVQPDDKYIFTREGDRFDLLAQEFYGDITFWWIIAIANDLRPASMIVPTGIQLRIPAELEYYDQNLRKAEEDK